MVTVVAKLTQLAPFYGEDFQRQQVIVVAKLTQLAPKPLMN